MQYTHHPDTSCWGCTLCHLPRVSSHLWWYTQTGLPLGTTAGCTPHQWRHFDSERNSVRKSAGIVGPGYKLHRATQWARAKASLGHLADSLLLVSSEEKSAINQEMDVYCVTVGMSDSLC